MDTMTVYNQHQQQLNDAETLERMLEKWYKTKLFILERQKAQEALLHVLHESRLDKIFVEQISSLIFSTSSFSTKL